MNTSAITLSDREGLLSMIPVVLGFHPTDSVVVVYLTGPRHRMGLVMRVDFPTGDHLTGLFTHLAGQAGRQRADAALILLYHRSADTIYDEEIAPIFDIPVVGIVRITDPAPHLLHTQGHAEAVVAGRRILPNRDALARTVEFDPRRRPAEVEGQLEPFATAVDRDAYVIAHLSNADVVAELLDRVRYAPDSDPRTPHLLAALAILAYRHHDGALAVAAVTRAQRINPHHRMTQLMAQAIQIGLPPDRLAAGLLGTT